MRSQFIRSVLSQCLISPNLGRNVFSILIIVDAYGQMIAVKWVKLAIRPAHITNIKASM